MKIMYKKAQIEKSQQNTYLYLPLRYISESRSLADHRKMNAFDLGLQRIFEHLLPPKEVRKSFQRVEGFILCTTLPPLIFSLNKLLC